MLFPCLGQKTSLSPIETTSNDLGPASGQPHPLCLGGEECSLGLGKAQRRARRGQWASCLLELGEALGSEGCRTSVAAYRGTVLRPFLSQLLRALQLVFPQTQSSSGGWLRAWPQGTVFSLQHHNPSLHPSAAVVWDCWGLWQWECLSPQTLGQPCQACSVGTEAG